MVFPFLGYVVASTVITAVAVLLTGLVNTSTLKKGRHHPPPVIARTVKVEVQRHPRVAKEAPPAKEASPVAKEASPAKKVPPVAKEVSPARKVPPVAATAKAETKKSKHYKPKVLVRQRNDYRYGNTLGYAQEYRYGPRDPFFQ
jgi:hypothetical protein